MEREHGPLVGGSLMATGVVLLAVPHELFRTFRPEGVGSRFYDTRTTDDFEGEVHLELVPTKGSVWADRPLPWTGVVLVVVGFASIGHFLWKDHKDVEERT